MENNCPNSDNSGLQPINIFLTEADRFNNDLSKMSNFLDGYVQQLSLSVQRNSVMEVVSDIPLSDLGIIGDVVHQASVVMKGNVILIPDFDNLPSNIKDKLKKKSYTIGESRQVNGNLRAVVLDENGQRVKDITLKKVVNNPGTIETVRSIEHQLQLRKISAKLADIYEFQQYQLEKDRNRDIDNHFLTARDLVLEAEARSTMEVRKTLLNEADAEMRKAISAIRSDIKTTSIHFAKVAGRPYNNLSSQVDTYMNYLIRDLQALKQYVGIRMQILAYLGETKTAALVMNQYQHILYDFLVEPVSKKGLSAAELLHNYFPYQKENMNCWYLYKKEMQPTLEKNIKELRLERGRPVGKEVYIVDLEEVEDGK